MEVFRLKVAADKSGDHGVSGPDRIDEGSLRRGALKDFSLFGDKHSAFTGHGDQDILRAFLLELLGIGDHLVLSAQRHTVDRTELVIVGLDQPGMIAERLCEKVSLCVDNDADSPAVQSLHDPLIDVLGKRVGDAARDDQDVACHETVEFLIELFNIFLRDAGPLPVDLGLLIGFHLDIDAGEAFLHADKIGPAPESFHQILDVFSGKACHKAERNAVMTQV